MNNIGEFLKTVEIKKDEGPKVEYEFQQLGLEMIGHFNPKYPSMVWSLFYRKQYSVPTIREAWIEYQKQKIKGFLYFMGILNKKVGIKKKNNVSTLF